MAAIASKDMSNRKVEINRKELLGILRKNRDTHLKEFETAIAGYAELMLERLNTAIDEVTVTLETNRAEIIDKLQRFSKDNIKDYSDSELLLPVTWVSAPVPRSYAHEYDTAIEMVRLDVRETLTLTFAEFQCFVRDNWDWKDDFQEITKSYAAR